MENTKMNFFQRIIKSISSPKEYYKLTRISGGRLTGFVFLFVLLITIIGTVIPMYVQILNPVSSLNEWLNDIPQFELNNGELKVEKTYKSSSNGVYLLVDTSNDFYTIEDYHALDLDSNYQTVIIIGKYNAIVSNGLGQVEEMVYSRDLSGFSFDNRSIIKSLKPIVLAVAPIVIYIVYLIGYFIFALLYSLFGLIVSALSNTKLPFGLIFKTAVFGKIVMMCAKALIELISGLGNFSIPSSLNSLVNIVGIAITCIYIAYGILSHKSPEAIEMFNRLAMQRGNVNNNYNNNYYDPNYNSNNGNYYNQNNNSYNGGYNNPNNYGPNNGNSNPNNGPNNGGYSNPNNYGPNNGNSNPNNGPYNGGYSNPNNYDPNNVNSNPNNGPYDYSKPNYYGSNDGYNNPNNYGPNNRNNNPNNGPYDQNNNVGNNNSNNYNNPIDNQYNYDSPSSYNHNNNQNTPHTNPDDGNGLNNPNRTDDDDNNNNSSDNDNSNI